LLKAHHTVIFGVGVGGINRSAKAAILAGKVLLSDPTGPATESSNRDSNLAGRQEVHQFLQRGNPDAVDLLGNAVLD
jgi:hypothetical protein